VVLHFWATWCEACRDEFPSLRGELLGLPKRGVGVLLVSIDRPDQRAKARRMLGHYRLLSLPAVLLDAAEPDPAIRAVGEPRWDGTLPATFVFDADGKLHKSFVGRADPAALDAAVRALKR
jgi:peroxiredoxin